MVSFMCCKRTSKRSDMQVFSSSGPSHLTQVDWENPNHQRIVAASLVQALYVLKRDRKLNREGPEALAPPWWEFFGFRKIKELTDGANSVIFGAIFEFGSPTSDQNQLPQQIPKYVVAFRGTDWKLMRDVKLNFRLICNRLHLSSRCELAMQAVQEAVRDGHSNVWLAGHSLGSAIAMVAGMDMAKSGISLEAFLFNPPIPSVPFEKIKNEKLRDVIQTSASFLKAWLAYVVKGPDGILESEDSFTKLSEWAPCLFVNRKDYICSGYIPYFELRKRMEEYGMGCLGKVATRTSIRELLLSAVGSKSSDPVHLLPSAMLIINLSPPEGRRNAHRMPQWWSPDLNLKCDGYHY